MEDRALCFRLMLEVLFLLAALDEVCCSIRDNAVFPQVTPNRQQFFGYDPIFISCEGLMGLTGWRVMKRIRGDTKPCYGTWVVASGACKIDNAIPAIDAGEYWCEHGATRSGSVNITVTAGPVILESPALPVKEGGNVTLSCRNKQSSPNVTAHFFKDGVSMGISHTGAITIVGVSRSHEGLYKCIISGEGESPQSWLIIEEVLEDPTPSPSDQDRLLVWICVGVCVFLVVLLLLVGFSRHKKRPTVLTADTPSSVQSPAPTQTVSEVASRNDPTLTTYGLVNKPKKQRAFEEVCVDNSIQSTYALIDKPKKRKAPNEACVEDLTMQSTYSFIDQPEMQHESEEAYLDNSMQSTYALLNKPTKKTVFFTGY